MGNRINHHNRAIARTLLAAYPVGTDITIDQFDMFIIDNGLAKNPGTSEPKDPSYKGFVQERSSAKGSINRAAASLNGDAFTIEVVEAGKTYTIAKWGDSAASTAKAMGDRVRTFTKNRQSALESSHRKVVTMMRETDGEDPEITDLHEMLSMMSMEGVRLESKVIGLVSQYTAAANAVEDQIRIAADKRKQLGHDGNEPEPADAPE